MQVLCPPVNAVVNRHLVYFLRKFIVRGHREPLPTMRGLYPVSVLVLIFFVLNIVQKDKEIAPVHFVKVAKPRHKLRLVNGNDHYVFFSIVTNIGLLISLPSISIL